MSPLSRGGNSGHQAALWSSIQVPVLICVAWLCMWSHDASTTRSYCQVMLNFWLKEKWGNWKKRIDKELPTPGNLKTFGYYPKTEDCILRTFGSSESGEINEKNIWSFWQKPQEKIRWFTEIRKNLSLIHIYGACCVVNFIRLQIYFRKFTSSSQRSIVLLTTVNRLVYLQWEFNIYGVHKGNIRRWLTY